MTQNLSDHGCVVPIGGSPCAATPVQIADLRETMNLASAAVALDPTLLPGTAILSELASEPGSPGGLPGAVHPHPRPGAAARSSSHPEA